MSWLFLTSQVVCSFEGGLGALLNLYLFYLVAVSKTGTSDRVYKISISVFSLNGFFLCTIVAIFNYAHIFRDGIFVAVAVNPLAQFVPRALTTFKFRLLLVLLNMIWTLIPVSSALQLMTLSRKFHWSETRRLLISFIFPTACVVLIVTSVEEMIPSNELEKMMIRVTQEFYEINETLSTYGGTMKYPEANYGRTLVYFAVCYAIIPYSLTYAILGVLIFQIQKRLRVHGMALSGRTVRMQRAFFVMQLLQSILPMAILGSPFCLFLYGVFSQTDLGLGALWLTTSLWLCSPVQVAIVQLRYIVQAARAKSLETSTVSVIPSRSQIPQHSSVHESHLVGPHVKK